jgi:hypothetical protein
MELLSHEPQRRSAACSVAQSLKALLKTRV